MRAPTKITPQVNALPQTVEALAARQRLDSIPGLNVELGLYRIRGNLEGYQRMLKAFMSGHAEEVTQLADALAMRDLGTVKEIAHSLKGSGGTIGAERLAELATELDTTLRGKFEQSGQIEQTEHNEIETQVMLLIAELAALIDGMRVALKP